MRPQYNLRTRCVKHQKTPPVQTIYKERPFLSVSFRFTPFRSVSLFGHTAENLSWEEYIDSTAKVKFPVSIIWRILWKMAEGVEVIVNELLCFVQNNCQD
jgi:hypothetical protein